MVGSASTELSKGNSRESEGRPSNVPSNWLIFASVKRRKLVHLGRTSSANVPSSLSGSSSQ